MPTIPCRLCAAPSRSAFSVTYLGQLSVQMYRCDGCEGLQTELPYWLDVAYDKELAGFGTDTAIRFRNMEAWVSYVALVFAMRPSETSVLDYGSGPALLVRMLRDLGFQAFAYDPHTRPIFAREFSATPDRRFRMLLAIETWEHFSNPAAELDLVFAPRHELVIARTQVYRDEGSDWYYYFAEGGQHVFFYSRKARQWIAKKYGYEVVTYGDMAIFSLRPLSIVQRKLLDHHRYPLAALRSVLPLVPRAGVARDDKMLIGLYREMLAQAPWSARIQSLISAEKRLEDNGPVRSTS